MYMGFILNVCLCLIWVQGPHRGQKMTLYPKKLEFNVIVIYPVGVLNLTQVL